MFNERDDKKRAREIRDELEKLSQREKSLVAELLSIIGVANKMPYCTTHQKQATLSALKALAV